jgi:hypothetical protein
MQITDNETDKPKLRIIKTARSEQAINEAVEQGYWPLVKPVIPSPDIKVKFAVKQNRTTGRVTVVHDFRDSDIDSPLKPVNDFVKPAQQDLEEPLSDFPQLNFIDPNMQHVTVIGWTYYYPYHFDNPFAAYLIPSGLLVGEVVMLEDLIEDLVGNEWNQGDTYRLASCEAAWDGKEFILRYDPDVRAMVVG